MRLASIAALTPSPIGQHGCPISLKMAESAVFDKASPKRKPTFYRLWASLAKRRACHRSLGLA